MDLGYGSLPERSFSRFLAYEATRLLEAMGGEMRIYDAHGLPLPYDSATDQPRNFGPKGRLRGFCELRAPRAQH